MSMVHIGNLKGIIEKINTSDWNLNWDPEKYRTDNIAKLARRKGLTKQELRKLPLTAIPRNLDRFL